VRTRWRSPDDLAAALTAYRHAIRAHRRLAKLAPSFFDSVVVERERRRREDRRRWMAQWAPDIAKAYGTKPKPYDPTPDMPIPPSSPRTLRAVDRELAAWDFWLCAARMAMDRYQQRRPHDLMSFSRIARLLQISIDLRQLALGIDPEIPNPQPDDHKQAWADLKRAYGHLLKPVAPNATERSSPSNSAINENPPTLNGSKPPGPAPSLNGESLKKTEPPASASTPAAVAQALSPPVPIEYRRRDAYASFARNYRQAAGGG
jgi:hypothetical protein